MPFDLPPLRIALYFSLVGYPFDSSKMPRFQVAHRCGISDPVFVGPFWPVRCEVKLYNPSAERRSSEWRQQLLWLVPSILFLLHRRSAIANHRNIHQTQL